MTGDDCTCGQSAPTGLVLKHHKDAVCEGWMRQGAHYLLFVLRLPHNHLFLKVLGLHMGQGDKPDTSADKQQW